MKPELQYRLGLVCLLAVAFAGAGCKDFNLSMEDYIARQTGEAKSLSSGVITTHAVGPTTGRLVIPPASEEPETRIRVNIDNPQGYSLALNVTNATPGSNATYAAVQESTGSAIVSVRGANVGDVFNLVMSMKMADGSPRTFAPYTLPTMYCNSTLGPTIPQLTLAVIGDSTGVKPVGHFRMQGTSEHEGINSISFTFKRVNDVINSREYKFGWNGSQPTIIDPADPGYTPTTMGFTPATGIGALGDDCTIEFPNPIDGSRYPAHNYFFFSITVTDDDGFTTTVLSPDYDGTHDDLNSGKSIENLKIPILGTDGVTREYSGVSSPTTETTGAYAVMVPYGVSLTSLAPTFNLSDPSARVYDTSTPPVELNPHSLPAWDFSTPKHYIVVAEDGTTRDYTVTVTNAKINEITGATYSTTPSFTIGTAYHDADFKPNLTVTGKDETNTAITINPADFNFPATTTFTTAGDQTVRLTVINGQFSSTSTNPQYHEVLVHVMNNEKQITSFSVTDPVIATATINETAKTINFTVPYGTALRNIYASVGVSADASVSPASGTGADYDMNGDGTPNTVTYTVTAEDGTTQNYTVSVTVEGQAGITIDGISDAGLSVSLGGSPLDLSKSGAGGKPTSSLITVSCDDATSMTVRIDGAAVSSGLTPFTINAADYLVSSHSLTIIVLINGVPYSKNFTFTVAE